ncbi:MAG TPA: phosphoribosyltransferase [Rhizomicrobium sp.]|jgi:predicted phosphoribosyltransferase|nr:phosphoribosyltransferase [Rhizomicrobium sp.]
MLFRDRSDAGRKLAAALQEFRDRNCVILALPRGGVPVAAEVARSLRAPLDIVLVRKIGAPGHPELAVGSVVDGDVPIIVRDPELLRLTGTSQREFEEICARELAEGERRRKLYLGARAPLPLAGRTAIVIDDGLATGNTMRAALQAARQRGPAELVMAVPVAPADTIARFRDAADRTICLATPEPFAAVGQFYADFAQTSDQDVIALLARFAPAPPSVEPPQA